MVGAWCQETDVVLTGHIQNTHFLSRHICPTLPAPGEGEETGRTWKCYYPVRSRSRQGQHQGQAGVLPIIHLLAQPSTFSLLSSPETPPQVGGQEQVTLTTARRCWYLLHPAPSPHPTPAQPKEKAQEDEVWISDPTSDSKALGSHPG